MSAEAKETELPLIERFGRALAQIVHAERPDALERAITVAELYQDIAPYRRMRDLAGIEMHADYEHALMRVLAGENGYARLEPESARDELRDEAQAVDPNLSAYRKFAACDVRLVAGALGPGQAVVPRPPAAPAAPLPRASEPAPPAPADPPSSAVPAAATEATEATPETSPDPAPPLGRGGRTAAATGAATRCGFCGQTLPSDREVRYCPYCGGDQMARRCADCGEDLEEGWRYCVACGAEAPQ